MKYDIALSYASEDKGYVHQVRDELLRRKPDVKIYDYSYGKLADEWGENLKDLLVTIYGNLAYYTLAFISKKYKEKFTTTREIRAAHRRAVISTQAYLLPLKLDNTEMEEVDDFIFRERKSHSVSQIVDELLDKLKKRKNESRPVIEFKEILFSYKGWHKKQFKIDGMLVSVEVNQIRVKAFSELKKDKPFYEKGLLKYNNYQGVIEINKKECIIRIDINMWWGIISRIRIEQKFEHKNIIYEYYL